MMRWSVSLSVFANLAATIRWVGEQFSKSDEGQKSKNYQSGWVNTFQSQMRVKTAKTSSQALKLRYCQVSEGHGWALTIG